MRAPLSSHSHIFICWTLDSGNYLYYLVNMDEEYPTCDRYFIKEGNGHLLYHLPKSRYESFHWELDMCDRDSEYDTFFFKDEDSYWSLQWPGNLDIEALVKFFVEKTINEKDLLDKFKITVKRSFSSEPDTGPWISLSPNAGKL